MRFMVNKVIDHKNTVRKYLSDFPVIDKYIKERFGDIDLSDIQIYMSSGKVIDKAGFEGIGGCYVDMMKTILVKDKIEDIKATDKFSSVMQDVCKLTATMEDILVHELIHAVSAKIGRALSKYRHTEEEFVYTNCIDFYRQKGMSDEDIVNNNFLPFCIADVYASKKEMQQVFKTIGVTFSEVRGMSDFEYKNLLNKNAEKIAPVIKDLAQKKAYKMIELYTKNGNERDMNYFEQTENISRASFLDFS